MGLWVLGCSLVSSPRSTYRIETISLGDQFRRDADTVVERTAFNTAVIMIDTSYSSATGKKATRGGLDLEILEYTEYARTAI